MFDYVKYAQQLRNELHQVPEIGFDLPKTTAIVKRELDAMGISYTEKFGKGSIVATINEGKSYTIGIRGDMDALPVQEETGLPYASRINGVMHACGHDGHTAMALWLAEYAAAHLSDLPRNLLIIFQPAEEGRGGGSGHFAQQLGRHSRERRDVLVGVAECCTSASGDGGGAKR